MLNDYSRLSGAMLERMETSVAEKAPHLLPVVQVVRDVGVGFLVIPQRATGLNRGIDLLTRPFIVLVGDDMDSGQPAARGERPRHLAVRRFVHG